MPAHEHVGEQFDTLYHLTDKRKFKLDPKKVPADNALTIFPRSRPGVFAAKDVEPWWNGHQYHRAYVAEIQVPKGVAQDERWGNEKFIPGEQMHQATVSRVMPTDAWVRERYGEPGWIEEHHGTEFDTGKPIQSNYQPGQFRGYAYTGPDVREFTPEQHGEHMKRLRSYRNRPPQ